MNDWVYARLLQSIVAAFLSAFLLLDFVFFSLLFSFGGVSRYLWINWENSLIEILSLRLSAFDKNRNGFVTDVKWKKIFLNFKSEKKISKSQNSCKLRINSVRFDWALIIRCGLETVSQKYKKKKYFFWWEFTKSNLDNNDNDENDKRSE